MLLVFMSAMLIVYFFICSLRDDNDRVFLDWTGLAFAGLLKPPVILHLSLSLFVFFVLLLSALHVELPLPYRLCRDVPMCGR